MNSPHAGRWRRRSGGSLAILALCAAMAAPAAAQAAGAPGTGPFGLTPTPTPAGQPRPYFQMTIAPGKSAGDTAIISNQGTGPERLKVTTSKGVTAANSGSAFEGTAGTCAGTSCWVTGLPATVTLAPGARRALSFRVTVPRQARPGQYLAGITAESAIRPRQVRVGSNGHASARAIIIDEVTVGVAITVGPRWRLRTALAIQPVSAGWIGSTPRLYIPVRNPGQTFVRATGSISCRSAGRRHSYRVIVETVLPRGGAMLPINAPGLDSGPVPCTVRLYDGTSRPITWSGIVNLPARTPTTTFHPAKGVYVSLPEGTVPPWAVALMVVGGLILTSLLALLIQNRRRLGRPAGVARSHPAAMARRRPGMARSRLARMASKRTVT
jgi:hypothetical protein